MRRWLRGSLFAGLGVAFTCAAQDTQSPYPVLVTAATRADSKVLAELQKPGTVLFSDGFDSEDSFKSYYEVGGLKEGRAKIVTDAAIVRTGKGALQLTAAANDGKSSGASVYYWFGPDGHDRVHIRYSIKFAADYNQGNLNHTGGGLSGVAGADKWRAMGGAGIKPKGDDHFNSRLEAWRDWGRFEPPGYLFCYSYWMDMRIDKDGNYWGNMLGPTEEERFVPERGRWYCVELMVKANTVGKADGELAAWIDGKLGMHYTGFRWRSTDAVKLKRASLAVYVHEARKDNTVWYDDFVVSTGYIGPVKHVSEASIRALKLPSEPLDPTLGGGAEVKVLESAAELRRLVGPKVGAELARQVDFATERVLFVSWGTSGPPFGTLQYELKKDGLSSVIEFYVKEPTGAGVRGQAYRMGADFFAASRSLRTRFRS